MTYYEVNTIAETVSILEMFPTQEGAYRYTYMMQPWFAQHFQVVKAVDQQYNGGWPA